MENVIKRIQLKISELETRFKEAKEVRNLDACTKLSSQITGLYIALNIALEEQGKEISGE